MRRSCSTLPFAVVATASSEKRPAGLDAVYLSLRTAAIATCRPGVETSASFVGAGQAQKEVNFGSPFLQVYFLWFNLKYL